MLNLENNKWISGNNLDCEYLISLDWAGKCSHTSYIKEWKNTMIDCSIIDWTWLTVQFRHSIMSDSLQHCGLRHARLPYHQLPELAQTHVHWVSDAIQQFHPLSSPSPPAFNLSQRQGLFQGVGSSNQVAKILKFQLQYQSFHEYSGLFSFRMDWLDLLAVQGTLKSLLQYHSSKTLILQCSAFFIVQLSYPYIRTGKTIALTR